MDLDRFVNDLPARYYAWGSANAYPRDPLRYVQVLDTVQGMTTPSTMDLINHAVRCMAPHEVYLETGTWRGATLIGALLGNTARGYAIDDDSMDEYDGDGRKSADVWRENVTRHGMQDRATYIAGRVPDVWRRPHLTDGAPVGVYLFDGDKSTVEAAYAGLEGVIPLLARRAVILLDDANTQQIRRAAYLMTHHHPTYCCKVFDFPTPANCWSSFWNGMIVLLWGAIAQIVD